MNLLLIDPTDSVSNLVLSHSECAQVLRRHRIDYCCDGDVSVQQAANRRGVDFETLAQELLSAICDRGAQEMQDPRELSTTDLIAHIIRNHHQYVRRALPEITFLASKVGRVHGGLDPRLQDLSQICSELAVCLTRHMDEEEISLFPLLQHAPADLAQIGKRLRDTEEGRSKAGRLMSRIRDISQDYRLPDWACTSYRTLFSELEHLEAGIHQYIHLENHVLVPRFLPTRLGRKCIRVFREEHSRFAAVLELLEEQLTTLANGRDPDYELLFDIFRFLSDFADQSHHPFEGRVFELVAEGQPEARRFVETLAEKHHAISQLGTSLVTLLRAAQGDTVVSRDNVESAARKYVALFREHMRIEEEHLFEFVESYQGAPQWLADDLSSHTDPLSENEGPSRFRRLRGRLRHPFPSLPSVSFEGGHR